MAAPARILIHLDHNPHPRVYDRIMSLDGGADFVLSYGDVDPQDVPSLVSGALFSRPAEELARTAVLVTGTNDHVVDEMLRQARRAFFGGHQVSLMSECKGGNAVAAAAVARIAELVELHGAGAAVIGGGPVGARVAGLLARAGARVTLSAFDAAEAEERRDFVQRTFEREIDPVVWKSGEPLEALLAGARVVVSAGPAGLLLVPRVAWEAASGIELLVDVSGAEPAGIEGMSGDEDGAPLPGTTRPVRALGGLAISRAKIRIHREAVARLFGPEPIVLGPVEIAALARERP
ncbi:MAG TPA: methylene-tetrahydromethanopterin dehydrogenase N-terminal domain-containing protein [Gemmatimonadota bacterium]|nr:methylene-tetrahydromethanopterin dehydrogenase N-terminal domain-containing protein [Gemmatimonadota bacterium]